MKPKKYGKLKHRKKMGLNKMRKKSTSWKMEQ